jgi:hypothetical protein
MDTDFSGATGATPVVPAAPTATPPNGREVAFEYAVCGATLVLFILSWVLPARLGFSYPWVLIAGWALLLLAGAIGVARLRRLVTGAPAAAPPFPRRDRSFRVQMGLLLLALVAIGLFMSANLWLDAIDQDQNGSGDDDASCRIPTALRPPLRQAPGETPAALRRI